MVFWRADKLVRLCLIQLMKANTWLLLLCIFFSVFSSSALAGKDKSGVSPQAISLPSGPGSIEGLGESFEPQLNSGTVSYRIPFKTLPGRAGFQPELAISYNGGSGNTEVGLGWALNHYFIQRQTDKGLPEYDETDVFVDQSGEELVNVGGETYRAENESRFFRYVKQENGWLATAPSGVKMEFGRSESSQVQSGGNIFKWLLERKVDLNGNEITYHYQTYQGNPQQYLTEIRYNISQDEEQYFSIKLEYETREDQLSDYRARFLIETAYRLKSIEMWQTNRLVRKYQFAYHKEDDLFVSLIKSVQQTGSDGLSSLPPVEFNYSAQKFQNILPQVIKNAPQVILALEEDATFNDMNGDALPDLLFARSANHIVYPNLGFNKSKGALSFGEAMYEDFPMQHAPAEALGNDSAILADINADGLADFIARQSDSEYSAWLNDGNYAWLTPVVVENNGGLPFDFEDPAIRLVDVNNDKYIDVMYCNDSDGELYSYFINDGGAKYRSIIEKPGLGDAMTFDQRPEMKLVDMNGDRLLDIVLVNDGYLTYWPSMGNGDWDLTQKGDWLQNEVGTGTRMFNAPDSSRDDESLLAALFQQVQFADLNGDGLSDAWFAPEGADYIRVWLNKDSLRFADSILIEDLPINGDLTTVSALDINGNGTQDFVWNYPEGWDESYFYYLELYQDEKPNLLTSVSNGIGKVTTFAYTTLVDEYLNDMTDNPWSNSVPVPINLLAEVNVFDGQTHYVRQFDYAGGYYDTTEQEFRGFESATQSELGSQEENAPTLLSKFTYDTGKTTESLKGKALSLSVQNTENEEFFRESYDWQVKDFCQPESEEIEPLLNCGEGKSVSFAFQAQREKTVLEKGNGTPVSLRWQYEYDDYGNNTVIVEHGRLDDGWDDERKIINTYSAAYESGSMSWVLDKLVTSTRTDENGSKVAEQRLYYDGNTELGALSAANLTLQQDWVGGNDYVNTARNHYDEWGNVVRIEDPNFTEDGGGHYRTITYDETIQTYPVTESIVIDTDTTLKTTAEYDLGFGVVTSSTDFNGNTTIYAYDTFARIKSMTKPGDTLPTTEYNYVLAHDLGDGKTINWVETRQRESALGGTVDSRKFFDGLSRHVMTRAEGELQGQVVVSDTVQFNQRKTPHKKYLPYFETIDTDESDLLDWVEPSFSQPYTEHFYDALGREIRMDQPDGSYSQIDYEPLVRIVKDEAQTDEDSVHSEGAMRYEEDGLLDKDGNGRLRKVTEIFAADEHWLTEYRYDLLDNLTGYTDSQGNQKHMEYDGLSRKTFMNDPDRGVMYYTYDDASNLVSTVDAKNQTILLTYDGANRLLTETYGAQKTTPDVQYVYDTAHTINEYGDYWLGENPLTPDRLASALLENSLSEDYDINNDGQFDVADVVAAQFTDSPQTVTGSKTTSNPLGQLVKVQDTSGEIVFSYDNRGRNTWTRRTIKNNSGETHHFYTAMQYDSMDRVTELVYPDSSYLTYDYNNRGLLESIPGIITQLDYNPAGQNLQLNRTNGVHTQYSYDLRLRLSQIQSKAPQSLTLQHLSYQYDNVSNITQISDGRSDDILTQIGNQLGISETRAKQFNATQHFTYDNLYRLTRAANDDVFGSVAYGYDQIGNMISKVASLTSPDPLMNLGTMTHGGELGSSNRNGRAESDAPGPHALTRWGSGDDAQTIEYDANGNTISERGQHYNWDVKDRLSSMSKAGTTANYHYDYQDSRKYKIVQSEDNTSEVFYIDKYSEVRDGELIKYAYAGTQRIARSKGQSNSRLTPKTFYLHDHLGSTNLATDTAGVVTEQVVNYPFGRVRLSASANDKAQSDYRFTGKEKDNESELQYFEARYLGVAGTFISVDKYFAENSKLLVNTRKEANIYSYSRNNPLSFIDSSGNCAEPFSMAVCIVATTAFFTTGTAYVASKGAIELNRFHKGDTTERRAMLHKRVDKGILGKDGAVDKVVKPLISLTPVGDLQDIFEFTSGHEIGLFDEHGKFDPSFTRADRSEKALGALLPFLDKRTELVTNTKVGKKMTSQLSLEGQKMMNKGLNGLSKTDSAAGHVDTALDFKGAYQQVNNDGN